MTTGTDDGAWVVAVDVRAPEHLVATADARGVRTNPPDAGGSGLLGDAVGLREGAPLAVVVVHPATWDDADLAVVLAEVAAGAPLGWPAPVPLSTPEAAAWRALEFGLVPARGRLAVLDPVAVEAAIVDREGDLLVAVGRAVSLAAAPAAAAADGAAARDVGVRLVALARQALDQAPAGPPFAGVLLAGVPPGSSVDGAELPGLVARITGRPPLVPGDPAMAAVLGAAALGWAVATTPAEQSGSPPKGMIEFERRLPPGRLPAGDPAAPADRVTRGVPVWAVALVGVLVAVAMVAGLGWHRARNAPLPFTYTCPDGQVVAYSYECATLAPSATP
ncbi:MAG: hypothetical protein ACXV1K_05230 [Kineosporiaceae bacterium]